MFSTKSSFKGFMVNMAVTTTAVSYALIIKTLTAVHCCISCVHKNMPGRTYRVLNHLTQLCDCNRRLLPLSQLQSKTCLLRTTGPQENGKVRSCCCYLSEGFSNFGDSSWLVQPFFVSLCPFGSGLFSIDLIEFDLIFGRMPTLA